ncbi:Oidioi.mRNA.OKI2018_I69.chr2.g5980.t1.cds [Oikopleura dioica]|uniref:Oidioi.mRNA.OKI2018_I69.chr2.g5980.t1.cds n=1 Tax=Oikopleura dioica TaxID=34765 RepID=A0ABN7T3S8_OIKDI|nr:Oidioi.mRNA.OKI2018_I69.chr2.g5980.t1.cds [Oikopleura dioica]
MGREESSVNRADLHIALLPREAWIQKLNYAQFQSISDAVSLGFVRVDPDFSLSLIRKEISRQIRFRESFTFLRHVGRALVVVKKNQEEELRHRGRRSCLIWHLVLSNFNVKLQHGVVQLEKLAKENSQANKAIRRLYEEGILEDIFRFFETDKDRIRFIEWMSEQTSLDDLIHQMKDDPFSGIKSYLIKQGTFWNEAQTAMAANVDKRRRFVWGSTGADAEAAKILKNLEERFDDLRATKPEPSEASPQQSRSRLGPKGYNNEYSDDDGYGYSDEENYQRREDDRSYENGYSKSHDRKARESKRYQSNELDYHHDRDILKDSQKGNENQSQFPSTSTNEELEEKIRQARAEQEAFRREEERRVRTEAEERRRKNVSRLNRLRQEQKTAEDRRLAVVAQERHLKNEIADIEERRAELEKLIMLEIERSRRLEEQRNPNSKAKNPSKRKPVLGSVEFKRNANRDRIIQMAERIKFTKLRNENTIKRIENETARRKKMEEELRRVRSDMIRAKISHNRTYRTNNTKRNRAK